MNNSNKQENRRLKIGLFIDTFFPMADGVIMVVDNYAKRLCKMADVTVFTISPRKKFDDSTLPYKVVRCPKMRLYGLDYDLPLPKLSRKFKKAIDDANLDIIHIHSPFSIGKMGAMYAKKHNIPLVATMHSQYKKDFLRETHNCKFLTNILMKNIMSVFNMCDECWAVNKKVAELYVKDYHSLNFPCVRLNATEFKYLENADLSTLKQKYNIQPEDKVFFFLGRITFLKNIKFIVDSLEILKNRNFKFKMIFVGIGPDLEKMQKTVKEKGLENQIFFAGKITDLEEREKHYQLADLFLFPSLYDCNSIVQIEASSQKTPTLFLNDAITAGTITPEVNGYVANNSPEEYANKIVEIFKDEKHYKEVCENAYKDLCLSWDDCMNRVLDDYKRLINEKKNEK